MSSRGLVMRRIARCSSSASIVFLLGASGLAGAVPAEPGSTIVPPFPIGRNDGEPGRTGRPAETPTPAADVVRVVFRPVESAAISAEINARILSLPQREGDRFRKGEVLVAFDCRRTIAEHEATLAALAAARASHESQLRLQSYDATGSLAVAQAQFEMEKVEAESRVAQARRAACTIEAPFDGRVVEKMANAFEVAQPNQALIRIVNDARLEMVMMIASSRLAAWADGTRFLVRVDESAEVLHARVLQSTGAIDPVSQSARLIAELTEPGKSVVPGMSGTAFLEQPEGAR